MTNNILDKIDTQRLGELLQQARNQCGITQADAAKVIDAARTTMVAIEKGERRLKPNELIKLARAYGRAVSDFVRQPPVAQPLEVQFRAAYRRNQVETRHGASLLGLEEIPQRTDRMPVHYQHLAIEAFDQGLITEGRFANFLNVDRLEARRLAEVLRE